MAHLALLIVLGGLAQAEIQGGAPSGAPIQGPPPEPTPFEAREGGDVALGGTNEPTIAVNPLNPLNVAYASLFESRVSTDGGATWSTSTIASVPPTHGICGDPSLAFDSQGRLFWTYLGCQGGGIDLFIAQLDTATGAILAGYPVNITASINRPAASGFEADKEWLAADCTPGSPFQDRLYVVWTDFTNPTRRVFSTHSSDQGQTWSTALRISGAGEGFVWPTHNAVAPNGDVYVAYHSQVGFNQVGEKGGNPTGTSGRIYVARSSDGGVTFPQKTLPFIAGAADITFNVQSSPGTIPLTDFWTQGSVQPYVLPDPNQPGNVYVVACDDPDNTHGSGDESDVFIARSSDSGLTWSAAVRVDHGPPGTFQLFPTASIDKQTGCIAVSWYDNRSGLVNGSGNYLLELFYAVSLDFGLTFQPDTLLSDAPLNPDLGAPWRYPGPPPTLRIGEYMGLALAGNLYACWTGNTAFDQQIWFDSAPSACSIPPDFYCTAKTTSAGCIPFLTTTGAASASAGSFFIDSSDHIESETALYLYGFSKANLNFHGGKLCVNPFKRLSTLIKQVNGFACQTCAGNCASFSRNFNQRIQSGADPMLTPGQRVFAQVRQRDPANTIGGFQDNLSDAVTFLIAP